MRHVVKCVQDKEHLKEVLGRCPYTSHLVSLLSAEQEVTAHNLHATLLSQMKGLELTAALIDRTPDDRKFSVVDAANEPGVIWVWGSDPRYSSTVEPWNGVQFELMGHELLIRGNIGVDTLIFIDEFPQLNGGQKSTIIRKLLEFGRSSRVRNVLAVQTPAQVVAIYGEHEAQTLLGQMHLGMAFRHTDEHGKTYWSQRLGRMRGFEPKWTYSRQVGGSRSYGRQAGSGTSWSETLGFSLERYDLERVPPSDIGDLPIGSYEYCMY
jgi:type IV secretory pathway TraG/TraD family ATPase VirD4